MLGTCPTSSYTFSFASPCPSLSLWCPTYDSCGPSVRLSAEGGWTYTFCWKWFNVVLKSFGLSCGLLGDQAAGIRHWQHKPRGGAGVAHGGGDGVGLPSHVAAICFHGPCCHYGLQSSYWPRRCNRTCVLGQKQHRLQPHHICFHEQTGDPSSHTFRESWRKGSNVTVQDHFPALTTCAVCVFSVSRIRCFHYPVWTESVGLRSRNIWSWNHCCFFQQESESLPWRILKSVTSLLRQRRIIWSAF